MASTKEYLDFVMEQLSGLDELSSRAMMGEYILYYRGRIFGGVYDDRLLVKPVPMALRLMPDGVKENLIPPELTPEQMQGSLSVHQKRKMQLCRRLGILESYRLWINSIMC